MGKPKATAVKRKEISKRSLAVAARLRAGGFVRAGVCPAGFVRVQKPGGKIDIPADRWWRSIMQEIVRRHDRDGWTFPRIAEHITRRIAEKEGKKPRSSAFTQLTERRVNQLYHDELRLQSRGF